ncbi:50S ribosomal protein L4 [Candidatus Uhrbacteria bacterium CG_4_9_14_0_2_um_filter_41_50]|uniref:Large ribosomal subunit protein uL4 n=1 Tax=Candidatus Uhrbacteria bacterium CG_4_9_14_0_2_um_filter_41_50 TaxID=1975031 RepID=A0A2M8EQ95_9BACT|nr:MAG: 50S ribosomal protein L4 [Candidatus Uhrbacteria bacterium CG_4_10_14_3_um_filter_41_21]PIZ55228.1 MAG: 50S ribosomal protein L4 [Candidatus Uhrbacteria bacterium CG_4_10_14_0_2_um_filter_41_21]PJB84366.1 MAG: 50S ribosomal protein L4 [Candidatus Uhrbacteria bacterium CG_4_9_14_0_8_um_filter_41_16]PJC24908.1 MAG: 50S ribosomal protein L4 [Candidatus Uhrbacteria bacterium CG_4_9_14_0_2_um_filter_41_50]PJE74970.1 MAG: 50S ribosomal protein L4 [Candidatus Uhrbacteria bacterium CG10_big_fil
MAKVILYKIDGTKTGDYELPDKLFAVTVNPELVHEAIINQEANSRIVIANTKDRSEVRGGGKKPWKQKGTGRARHGSSRSPIWIGGGVTFGPNLFRQFGKKMNKKAKRKAMAMVLSDKVISNKLVVVEDLAFPEAKTKFVSKMRNSLPGSDSSAVIISAKDNQDIKLAARNLKKTGILPAQSINVKDLARYDYVIASKAAIEAIKETYL